MRTSGAYHATESMPTASVRPTVLHLGRFADPKAGGIPRHVSQLLSSLAPRIRVANLVASRDARTHETSENGYPVIEAACLGLMAGTAIAPRMIPLAHQLLRRLNADIVHLHFPDPLSMLVALSLPRTVHLVATWHSDVVRQKTALRLIQPLMHRVLARTSALIGATRALFDTSEQLDAVPAERRHVIPYGINVDGVDNPASRAAGERLRAGLGATPIILGAGRQVGYKGFDVLIEAMALVPQARLVLCGRGDQTAALKRQVAALGIGERVIFTGEVDDAELAAWFQACDVFCMPSVTRAETFGLVQLEAMSCAKPVVVTRLGNGVNEVHADGINGLSVPVRDPGALARALQRLIADAGLRHAMGQASRERVLQQYTIEQMRDATLAIYESVRVAR